MPNLRPCFQVPRVDQGQIVEVAYAACYGAVVRKITDRSMSLSNPERVKYAVAKMLKDDGGAYWANGPSNRRWRQISAAEAERYLSGEMM